VPSQTCPISAAQIGALQAELTSTKSDIIAIQKLVKGGKIGQTDTKKLEAQLLELRKRHTDCEAQLQSHQQQQQQQKQQQDKRIQQLQEQLNGLNQKLNQTEEKNDSQQSHQNKDSDLFQMLLVQQQQLQQQTIIQQQQQQQHQHEQQQDLLLLLQQQQKAAAYTPLGKQKKYSIALTENKV
jgi:hypothetical protein